ncbi:hypothetical protein AMTR_s00107p00151760 [Amborella trichopoda]|uniref:Uncharacterized protein n=1 Tax=Amborella trichopoda TaxID=13333 RepID=W1NYE6_AMBTC|nr:hypothetical protein AMTR_s00107p00151760 [Amborella trichopoda]
MWRPYDLRRSEAISKDTGGIPTAFIYVFGHVLHSGDSDLVQMDQSLLEAILTCTGGDTNWPTILVVPSSNYHSIRVRQP